MIGVVIDIVLGVALLIAFIVGAVKGFAKLFSAFASSVGTLVVSLIFAGYLAGAIMYADFAYSWTLGIGNWFAGIEGASTVVTSATQLETALSSGPLVIFSSFAQPMWDTMYSLSLETVGSFFGYLILQTAIAIVAFIVLHLFAANIFRAMKFILIRLSKQTSFNAIDKVFGVAWAIFMAYLVLIGVLLTGIEMLLGIYFPNLLTPILLIIKESTLLTYAHNTNFIGAIIAPLFGYTLPLLPA